MTRESENHYKVPADRADVLADIGYDPTLYTENREGIVLIDSHEKSAQTKTGREASSTAEASEKALNPMFKETIGMDVCEFIASFDKVFELYLKAKEAERSGSTVKPSSLEISILITSLVSNDFFRDELKSQPAFADYSEISTSQRKASLERSDQRDKLELSRLRRNFPS